MKAKEMDQILFLQNTDTSKLKKLMNGKKVCTITHGKHCEMKLKNLFNSITIFFINAWIASKGWAGLGWLRNPKSPDATQNFRRILKIEIDLKKCRVY